MSVEVITFGCRLNAFESEIIRRQAESAGLAQTIVINSCAVTNEAVAQARQSIRKLRRERPTTRIVVTGCAAQTLGEMFARMPEVDRVLGNEDKLRREAWRATAALVTAQLLMTMVCSSPAAPALRAITSDSKALSRQPKLMTSTAIT